ncbi:MAG: O-antigen ligase family protein [Thermomicrobium sp.]|nr:O-antigen ligase family protein [Thermomicrobium sp.]
MSEALRMARATANHRWFLLIGGIVGALVVVLPLPLGLGIVGGAIVAGASAFAPGLMASLLILSVPVQDVVRFPVGAFGVTATQLALAATTIALPVVVLAGSKRFRFPLVAQLLLIYLLVQLVSLAVAPNVLYGIATIYRWLAALVAFLAVIHFYDSRRAVVLLATALAAVALAEIGFGAIQSALGIAPPSFLVSSGIYRAYGTFGQPNPYAGYLEMVGLWLLPIVFWVGYAGYVHLERYLKKRWSGFCATSRLRRRLLVYGLLFVWLALGAAASFAGILLSFSRGAWVGTLAGLLVLFAFAPRTIRSTVLPLFGLAGLVLVGGGWQQVPEPIRERAQQLITQARPFDVRDVQLTGENWAVVERMVHWQAAWGMFLDHPLTGVGAGNFSVVFPEYSPHPLFRISRGHAHNYYLHVLAELGLPGFVVYLALLGSGVALMIGALRRRRNGLDRAIVLGALAATTAVAVHNLVENLHELHLSVHLFAMWGLVWLVSEGWKRHVSG